jgi:ABC-type nitrate/sulfonate/bicarbonate transport system substrate-binding protein
LEASPKVARGYADVLRQTAGWMKRHPHKAAEMMSKSVGGKVPAADFVRYMASELYATYTQDANLKGQAESMRALGVISRTPKGPTDFYAYPDEAGSKW